MKRFSAILGSAIQVSSSLNSGTGVLLEILGHSIPSRSQAFVHHDPGNLYTEPFRQFFDADGELLRLKAHDSNDLIRSDRTSKRCRLSVGKVLRDRLGQLNWCFQLNIKPKFLVKRDVEIGQIVRSQ